MALSLLPPLSLLPIHLFKKLLKSIIIHHFILRKDILECVLVKSRKVVLLNFINVENIKVQKKYATRGLTRGNLRLLSTR